MEKQYLNWSYIENLVDNLAKQIRESGKVYKFIHGVPRGGLIPAVMLSHKLGIRYAALPYSDTLIVDDIADTGETLKGYSTKYDIATLHYKPHCIMTPTFVGETVENLTWLVYPWESKDSVSIQDYKL